MSKLATVRSALQANVNITVVAVEESVHFPRPDGYWSHKVDFIVAPNRGIYDAKELQSFMHVLIPGLAPTLVDDFRDRDNSMDFGKLYFDEDIGHETIRHELTVLESDFFPAGAVENGRVTYEESRKIQRRTWVRLYPDQQIAMSRKDFAYTISRSDLASFKARGLRLGLVGRFHRVLVG